MPKPKVLLVDDDKNSLKGLLQILEQDGYAVLGASNGYEALHILEQEMVDIIVTDMKMPGLDGFALLDEVKKREEEISVIMITAYGSVHTAVEAMKKGAEDYLTKPLNVEELEIMLEKVWRKRELLLQNRALQEQLKARTCFSEIIGNTPEIQRLFKTIAYVAPSNASVLILGETGTGKELVARAIHRGSRRADKPFIIVNCSALSEGVLESELFGHERGAFTGAIRSKRGRFELAHGGTLFLDEVGEMPLTVQTKLLRVLERGEFERVGGERTLQVDVRLIAATNKDLEAEMQQGRFREDLYYRLNVITLQLPPLRDRREDIPLLADHF
ncbi:MAG: sigma-54-dependent Fis family transcriptional regulator, partial [Nitrospinota bacterium]